MTMIGVVPKNHPQQIKTRREGTASARRGRTIRQELATWRKARGVPEAEPEEGDERYTPLSLFLPLHREHRFVLDVAGCADAPATRVIGRWWDKEANALDRPWCLDSRPGPWWGNVPFSLWGEFLEKAWDERTPGMMLLPSNRTEQRPWQRLVEPYRDRSGSPLRTRFVESRQQFGTPDHPDGDSARWHSSPPYGLVLVSWYLPDQPTPRSRNCDGCGQRAELRNHMVGTDETLSFCTDCVP